MTNNWNDLIERLNKKDLKSPSWLSEQKALVTIVKYAQANGLDPENAAASSISNLRDIIAQAHDAIGQNWLEQLDNLFDMTAHLTSQKLRIALGKRNRAKIAAFKKGVVNNKTYFSLTVYSEQLERIKKSTEPFLIFEEVQ
jgi:hypothetical protein